MIKYYTEEKFRFGTEFKKKKSSTEAEKVINNLSVVKACQKDDIPTKVIKMNEYLFAGLIAKDFNDCVDKDVFSDDLRIH